MFDVNVGLIGASDVGRAHALALKNVRLTYGPRPAVPRLAAIYDAAADRAADVARTFGNVRQVHDWMEIVRDPQIHVVEIANFDGDLLEIARAAIDHGKHVLCEQVPAAHFSSLGALADAAESSDLRAGVCFPFLRNPIQALAKKLIAAGTLGRITGCRVTFEMDVAWPGEFPHHPNPRGSSGALHASAQQAIALALDLVGPIRRVCGMSKRFGSNREDGPDLKRGGVSFDDELVQFLCEFENGAIAHFSLGRLSTGRRFGLTYEVQGQLGAICFDQERMNEIELFRQDEPVEVRGYKTIYSGPDQPDYAAFHPLPGVGLSFNDQRTFDARAFIVAISEARRPDYDFHFAARIRHVEQSVLRSIEKRGWTALSEIT